MIIAQVIYVILILILLVTAWALHHFFLRDYLSYVSARFIAYCALFLAISVVFRIIDDQLFVVTTFFEFFALEPLALFLCGLILGPFAATIVGIFSDLLGSLAGVKGIFFIGFTFTNAITGFLAGVIVLVIIYWHRIINHKITFMVNIIALNIILFSLLIGQIILFFVKNSILPPSFFVSNDLSVQIVFLLITCAMILAINFTVFFNYFKYRYPAIVSILLTLFLRYALVSFVIDIINLNYLYNLPFNLLFYERLITVPVAFAIIGSLLTAVIMSLKNAPVALLLKDAFNYSKNTYN